MNRNEYAQQILVGELREGTLEREKHTANSILSEAAELVRQLKGVR